jgi:hypothetical protein
MESGEFERVFTMTDYWDGPRGGIASFRGEAHAYSSLFDYSKDENDDLYELRPVDEETLRLALEDWEIWLRWDDAFAAGNAMIETHPALPHDRPRHEEIAPMLASRLAALQGQPIRARGVFRPAPGHEHAGGGRWMEVKWTVVE